MATVYEKIPVPGFTSPTSSYADREIVYSTVGFTQNGVTVAAGQGILLAGTVLARKASDKKYYVYNNSGSGGIDIAQGVLRRSVDTTGGDQQANIVIAGILKASLVSGADSGALTDLGATISAARDTFKF